MTSLLESAGAAGGYPDRSARPGGRWSAEGLLDEILRLAATERALAHLIAGWAPKVPDLDRKIRLAGVLEETMARALALRGHALTLLERDESALVFRGTWVEPLRELDRSESPEAFVQGFSRAVAHVRGHYQDLAARLDPLYDARLLATVRGALVTSQLDSEGGGRFDSGPIAGAQSEVARSDDARSDDARSDDARSDDARSDDASPWSPLSAVAWAPRDRLPVPARPAGRPRPEPGAMGHLRQGSRHDDRNIAGELNENVTAELCAMELLCRSSYEHPDQPWPWHTALARHISDEARHAAIFRRLLVQRGYDEGGLPQHATNYELSYAFPECEPGSKRELLWRLLMLCTVLEGLAIDKIPPEIATLDWLGQHDIARALDYISTDELYHAENGLRLTRQLCEQLHLDPLIERERVHGRFFGRQLELRERYLAADPERAAREIAVMEGPDPDGTPFTSRTEVDLRRRASFSDAEMEQVRRWGYNPRS